MIKEIENENENENESPPMDEMNIQNEDEIKIPVQPEDITGSQKANMLPKQKLSKKKKPKRTLERRGARHGPPIGGYTRYRSE